jgi:hypothetical protein
LWNFTFVLLHIVCTFYLLFHLSYMYFINPVAVLSMRTYANSKKDRQYNGQEERDKKSNNDLQSTTQTT